MSDEKAAQTEDEALESRLSVLDDAVTAAEAVVDALRCAETVETVADFDANIDEALSSLTSLEDLLLDIKALRRK